MVNQKTTIFRYILEEGSKKSQCPACNKKRFVRYIDKKTGDYLPEIFGRCDREDSCGYFYDPYSDGYVNGKKLYKLPERVQKNRQNSVDFIPYHTFSESLKAYQKNYFIQYLLSLFDKNTVDKLISTYRIGTSKHWEGSTVFWQIDMQGDIRTGKVMLYSNNGHRVKEPYSHINWVHSLLYNNYNLEQCLFGEHLLSDDKRIPIAIVESEKTAILSSVYFPEYIWLAAGSKSNLKPERCNSLIGRRVVLFPDLGAFNDWTQKAHDLSYFCDISVSDVLESYADDCEKEEGYDLADYLEEYDIDSFLKSSKLNNT